LAVKKAKRAKKFRKSNERAEFLLEKLAETLDECRANKLNIKLRHGIVVSKYGYVLPTKRKWVVRMLIDTGLPDDEYEDD
jgi:ribosome recycling factor